MRGVSCSVNNRRAGEETAKTGLKQLSVVLN